jgi:DNA-binding HxlR family transcriptional regulator
MEDQKLPFETKIYTYGKTTELGRVLGLNGTIDILDLLDGEPRRYKDLDASVSLSQTSLTRRLIMLQNLDIIKKKPITSKRRETHVYDFTLRGIELMKFIKSYEKTLALPPSQQKVIEAENSEQ